MGCQAKSIMASKEIDFTHLLVFRLVTTYSRNHFAVACVPRNSLFDCSCRFILDETLHVYDGMVQEGEWRRSPVEVGLKALTEDYLVHSVGK